LRPAGGYFGGRAMEVIQQMAAVGLVLLLISRPVTRLMGGVK